MQVRRFAYVFYFSLAFASVIGCGGNADADAKPAEVKTPEAAKTQDFLTKDYGSMMKKSKGKTAPAVSKKSVPAPEPETVK